MIRTIAGAVFTVVIFNMVSMLVMTQLVPLAGLFWVIACAVVFYVWSVRRGRSRRQRMRALRLRGPDGDAVTLVLAIVATFVVMGGAGALIALIAPEIDASEIPEWYDMLRAYQEDPVGRVALAGLIAFAIPMVEEFSFRGRIQRALERRYGIVPAIVGAAVLFMTLHIGVPHWSILGISLTLGVLCGLAVHAFRSIWVAVLFHSLWNGSMLAAEGLETPELAAEMPANASLLAIGILLIAAGGWLWRGVLKRQAARLGVRVAMRNRSGRDRGGRGSGPDDGIHIAAN